MKNVYEIVKEWLDTHGYDGLCGDECGCSKDDLAPCGGEGCWGSCVPGYEAKDTEGNRVYVPTKDGL